MVEILVQPTKDRARRKQGGNRMQKEFIKGDSVKWKVGEKKWCYRRKRSQNETDATKWRRMGQEVDEMFGSWYVAKSLGVFIYESVHIILRIISTFACKIWVLPLESVVLWLRLKSGDLTNKICKRYCFSQLTRLARSAPFYEGLDYLLWTKNAWLKHFMCSEKLTDMISHFRNFIQ